VIQEEKYYKNKQLTSTLQVGEEKASSQGLQTTVTTIIFYKDHCQMRSHVHACNLSPFWITHSECIPVCISSCSKEKKYFMFGWTWEIEHKKYCLLLTWVSVCDMYLISTLGGGFPEIIPVCLDVDSMCWMCNYRNIFIIGC
jgi:hypothetical protein